MGLNLYDLYGTIKADVCDHKDEKWRERMDLFITMQADCKILPLQTRLKALLEKHVENGKAIGGSKS